MFIRTLFSRWTPFHTIGCSRNLPELFTTAVLAQRPLRTALAFRR
jgi:hypothetical protein